MQSGVVQQSRQAAIIAAASQTTALQEAPPPIWTRLPVHDPQDWPSAAKHITVCLESVHLTDPAILSSRGAAAVAVAYRLLPDCCPAEVQRTAALPVDSNASVPCNHAMAYCLAVTPKDGGATSFAATERQRFMTVPGGGIMPVSLVDAASGRTLAQGGVDLRAVCAAGTDIESGQLPLEDARGNVLAVLVFSLSLCRIASQLVAGMTTDFEMSSE